LTGAIIFSLGNGLWVLPILLVVKCGLVIKLPMIYFTTLCGLYLSIFFGAVAVCRRINILSSEIRVDYKILKRGLKVCLPVLLSTLAFRLSELLGRFLLANKIGMAASGVYSTYQILGSTILIVTESTISAIALPYLLDAYASGDVVFKIVKSKVKMQFIGISTGVSLILVFLFKNLVAIIAKPELLVNIAGFYFIVLGYCFLSISSYYQLLLYVRRQDMAIFKVNLVSACLMGFMLYLSLAVLHYGILGVSVGFAVWGSIQLIAKIRLSQSVSQSNQLGC